MRKRSPVSFLATQRRQSNARGIKSAVDRQDLTSDVACAVAAQKEDGLCQFFFKAITVERNGVVIIGADGRRVHGLGHGGIDRPRRHAIDTDAERGEFHRELLGQMRQAGLAGAVGRAQWEARTAEIAWNLWKCCGFRATSAPRNPQLQDNGNGLSVKPPPCS